MMSDLEFVGKMNPQRLRSWEEEFREEREQFYKDERDRELRRSGKLVEAEIELKCERDKSGLYGGGASLKVRNLL